MRKYVIFIFVGIIFLSSCNTKSSDSFNSEDIAIGDSIRTYYNQDTAWLSYISRISRAANLDKIDSGYKDYQLRVWLGHSMAVRRNIVIIKRLEQKWTAEVMTYHLVDYQRKMTTIKILDYKKVFPKSGWDTFNTCMDNFGIIPFVKSQEERGRGGGDGISYDFELTDNGKYFISGYGNPEYDTINVKQASDILSFSKMLESEFDFEYIK